jgi:hypothetical protein
MRASVLVLSLSVVSTYVRRAASQSFPDQDPPPKARTGFQLGLRTGLSIPFGEAAGATNNGDLSLEREDLSDVVSPQVPIFVEVGGKPIPNLFIGGYLGFGFGGAGSTHCAHTGATCVGVGTRVGVELQYHILPEARVNPWIGYGFGYESVSLSATLGSASSSTRYGGLELAHFMSGVDFRLSRVFGLGPFVGLSLGQYSRYSVGANSGSTNTVVENTALHEWFTLGLRTVFFP